MICRSCHDTGWMSVLYPEGRSGPRITIESESFFDAKNEADWNIAIDAVEYCRCPAGAGRKVHAMEQWKAKQMGAK